MGCGQSKDDGRSSDSDNAKKGAVKDRRSSVAFLKTLDIDIEHDQSQPQHAKKDEHAASMVTRSRMTGASAKAYSVTKRDLQVEEMDMEDDGQLDPIGQQPLWSVNFAAPKRDFTSTDIEDIEAAKERFGGDDSEANREEAANVLSDHTSAQFRVVRSVLSEEDVIYLNPSAGKAGQPVAVRLWETKLARKRTGGGGSSGSGGSGVGSSGDLGLYLLVDVKNPHFVHSGIASHVRQPILKHKEGARQYSESVKSAVGKVMIRAARQLIHEMGTSSFGLHLTPAQKEEVEDFNVRYGSTAKYTQAVKNGHCIATAVRAEKLGMPEDVTIVEGSEVGALVYAHGGGTNLKTRVENNGPSEFDSALLGLCLLRSLSSLHKLGFTAVSVQPEKVVYDSPSVCSLPALHSAFDVEVMWRGSGVFPVEMVAAAYTCPSLLKGVKNMLLKVGASGGRVGEGKVPTSLLAPSSNTSSVVEELSGGSSRCDAYALAALMYFAATGKSPYEVQTWRTGGGGRSGMSSAAFKSPLSSFEAIEGVISHSMHPVLDQGFQAKGFTGAFSEALQKLLCAEAEGRCELNEAVELALFQNVMQSIGHSRGDSGAETRTYTLSDIPSLLKYVSSCVPAYSKCKRKYEGKEMHSNMDMPAPSRVGGARRASVAAVHAVQAFAGPAQRRPSLAGAGVGGGLRATRKYSSGEKSTAFDYVFVWRVFVHVCMCAVFACVQCLHVHVCMRAYVKCLHMHVCSVCACAISHM
mmetsp:Transcript_43569/g.113453  ORF Transcript_43569/g.113453 Transcript_43569/m.113453 type:complete len:749 (-) Transcript_43569:1857-4103(-)